MTHENKYFNANISKSLLVIFQFVFLILVKTTINYLYIFETESVDKLPFGQFTTIQKENCML